MFDGSYAFNDPSVREWQTGNVKSMQGTFASAYSFNQPLPWDVSKVERMGIMFARAFSFNAALENWDVGKVTDFTLMFRRAHRFNDPSIKSWRFSQSPEQRHVIYAGEMFGQALSFDQDLSSWDAQKDRFIFAQDRYRSSVRKLYAQEISADPFEGTRLRVRLREAENYGPKVEALGLEAVCGTAWPSSADCWAWAFAPTVPLGQTQSLPGAPSFLRDRFRTREELVATLELWKKNPVAALGDRFRQQCQVSGTSCGGQRPASAPGDEDELQRHEARQKAIERYGPVDSWDVRFLPALPSDLFQCKAHVDQTNDPEPWSSLWHPSLKISNWQTQGVLIMDGVFIGCSDFNQELNWDVGYVESMRGMFAGCSRFNNPSVSNWNTRNVFDMRSMFALAADFNQPLNWDVSRVTTMSAMFHEATSFNDPSISRWVTTQVRNMTSMFEGATSFNQAPPYDVRNVTSIKRML